MNGSTDVPPARVTFILLVGALATTALSCRQVTPEITAVRIAVKTSSAFDQLEFSLEVAGVQLLTKTTRPMVAGGKLASTQDFVVYLDDDKAGMKAICTVTALLGAARGATGTANTMVVRRRVSECSIDLDSNDAGTAAEAPDTGGSETGASETGMPEAGASEMGAPDTGAPETGAPETLAPDTSGPDAGPPDLPDAGTKDAADAMVESPPEPARDGGLLDLNLLDLVGI
jgi:hypothetical protein